MRPLPSEYFSASFTYVIVPTRWFLPKEYNMPVRDSRTVFPSTIFLASVTSDMCLNQGGKRNPNPNFLVRIFSSGVGVFHVNGRWPKSSIRPSKPGKSNFLGGISRDFAGKTRGRPKSLRKKSLCSISVPY